MINSYPTFYIMTSKKQFNVVINAGTHGDEQIGFFVANELKKLILKKGSLMFTTGNEKACLLNKRFIDQDLNRSFPGNKNGNYEERRAAELLPLIKSADIVIDIHSTTSELKDALIVTKLDKKTREYIGVICPKYALYMKVTKGNALISSAKIGLAFEYGKDRDKKAIRKVVKDIKNLLKYLGMIEGGVQKKKISTTYFEVTKSIPKAKGVRLLKQIKNYKLVKKTTTYARSGKQVFKAEQDFYPILFGQNNYKEIFGFAGRKMGV